MLQAQNVGTVLVILGFNHIPVGICILIEMLSLVELYSYVGC